MSQWCDERLDSVRPCCFMFCLSRQSTWLRAVLCSDCRFLSRQSSAMTSRLNSFIVRRLDGNDKSSQFFYCEGWILKFLRVSLCFSTFLDRGKWCEFSVFRFPCTFSNRWCEAQTWCEHSMEWFPLGKSSIPFTFFPLMIIYDPCFSPANYVSANVCLLFCFIVEWLYLWIWGSKS